MSMCNFPLVMKRSVNAARGPQTMLPSTRLAETAVVTFHRRYRPYFRRQFVINEASLLRPAGDSHPGLLLNETPQT